LAIAGVDSMTAVAASAEIIMDFMFTSSGWLINV